MISTRSFGLCGAAVAAIAIAFTSISYAAAPDGGETLFGGSMVASEEAVLTSEGVAPSVAIHDLELQGQVQAARLPLRIETALGDSYAGIWFDPMVGKLDVGVTSASDERTVRQIVARAGLEGDVVEAPVRSTWGALVGAQARWNRTIGKLLSRGDATSAIDPSRNAVMITLSSSVAPRRRAKLEHEAAAAHPSVVIEHEASTSVRAQPKNATCENPFTTKKARCEKTLVSGVRVELEGIGGCTVGPLLINWTETYMVTAGHCYTTKTNKSTGTTRASSMTKATAEYQGTAGAKEIGKENFYYYNEQGDMGITRISTASPFLQVVSPINPVPALMAEWSVKPATPSAVTGGVAAAMNAVVCREGSNSGEQCGQITGLNVATTNQTHQVETNACSNSGDSGGPFVSGTLTSKAPILMEGILTAGNTNCPKNATTKSYFQPLMSLAAAPRFSILASFPYELLRTNNERRRTDIPNVRLNAVPGTPTFTIADTYYAVSNASENVACVNGLGKGEVTSTEAVGKVSLTLNGCMGQKTGEKPEECTVKSVGAKSEGEIVIRTLKGELGEVEATEAYAEGGLLLEPSEGKLLAELKSECLGTSTLLGSLAAEVLPAETSTKILEAYFAAPSGKPLIKTISVKAGKAKPKLELGGLEAAQQASLELEFTENVEVK